MTNNHRHTKTIEIAGKPIKEASKALIMIHGRGGSAKDFLLLADQFRIDDFVILAPQALHNTWYHYSCTTTLEHNEPWLSSILEILEELLHELALQGFKEENIYFLGFSQGACLSLEFISRHAERYGGVAAFTGGFMGDKIQLDNYTGDLKGTPIFIGTGDHDEHIPLERVYETVDILTQMNAAVHLKVYPNKPHIISSAEIEWANQYIFTN